MKTATPWRYTINSFLDSAAIMKNSEPIKKIWMTTMQKNGCQYHQGWPLTMRV